MSAQYPFPAGPPPGYPPPLPPYAPIPEQTKVVLPAILFLCTVMTTLVAGFLLHVNFVSTTPQQVMARVWGAFTNPLDLLAGLPFSFTILAILLAHEMGHYLACRFYGISATLPYVIPAPPPLNPFGTFGAIIKIRSSFPDRRQLFDVGIAGPLAGFVFVIPALILGLRQSSVFTFSDPVQQTLEFGEPLLFQLGSVLFFPGDPGSSISLHPIGWAAWFGMLATSINLLPIGQLDGGHIVYAIFGARGHRIVSYFTLAALIGISFLSWPMLGYLVFAFVLLFLGFKHPQPLSHFRGLGKTRLLLALIGLLIFVSTFMPIPVRLVEHVARL